MANLRKTVHASKVSTFRLKQVQTEHGIDTLTRTDVMMYYFGGMSFVLTQGHLATKEQK